MNKIMRLVDKEKVLEQTDSFYDHIQKAYHAIDIDDLKEKLDLAKGMFEVLDRLDLIAWRGLYIAELKMLEEKYNNYLSTYLGESKKL